ncbi:DUF3306 domain-containing protein [Sulfitobacter sp. S190]|uniref:DUF3306 domain-containing protein n=1 Tax=Sulfitobacter sp. S190 TaxID=2867022 RepID=UPI0021A51B9E|nr:DUF3306 domain-containing protein [Sulfitobacter sp. S190]UWR24338.1 DUF3306 domain-containing protein [Sulfitobacter sp. S190]
MSGFWDKRRAAVAAEAEADAQEAHAETLARQEAEQTDAEILADLKLPDPDTLEAGDDFSVFMSDVVPNRIKTRALRKLWRLNPVLANVDGLVDYGEDFTDAATVVENLQTTYQVGKGMLEHIKELARKAEADAQEPQAVEPDEDLEDDVPVIEEDVLVAETTPAATAVYVRPAADEEDGPVMAAAPLHRMQFQFEDQQG